MANQNFKTYLKTDEEITIEVQTPMGEIRLSVEAKKVYNWIQLYSLPSVKLNTKSYDDLKTEESHSVAIDITADSAMVIL